jgi:hypothetical protein
MRPAGNTLYWIDNAQKPQGLPVAVRSFSNFGGVRSRAPKSSDTLGRTDCDKLHQNSTTAVSEAQNFLAALRGGGSTWQGRALGNVAVNLLVADSR